MEDIRRYLSVSRIKLPTSDRWMLLRMIFPVTLIAFVIAGNL